MSKEITIEISDEVYDFLQTKSSDDQSIEELAVSYLEEGVNLEKTLRM